MRRSWALAFLLAGCAGTSASIRTRHTEGSGGPEGDARVAAFAADVDRAASETAPSTETCALLPVAEWSTDALLQIHEATACRYRVTWLGWSPPRDYDYVPDAQGFIVDYFIQGAHGWVFWNLRTGEVVVRPVDGQAPLDETSAREVAQWARSTNFPGLDPARVVLRPAPCVTSPCTPFGT